MAHKLSFWTGTHVQHIELDGRKWRCLAPHPKSGNRIFNLANGIMVTRGAGSFTEYYLKDINSSSDLLRIVGLGGGHGLSLKEGFFSPAWRLSHYQYNELTPNQKLFFEKGTNSTVWKATPIVDTSSIWIGAFALASEAVVLAEARIAVGVIFKLDDPRDFYAVLQKTGSIGAGFGVSGGLALGVFEGFKSASEIRNFAQQETELDLEVGAGWGQFVNLVTKSRVLAKTQDTIAALYVLNHVVKGQSGDKLWGLVKAAMKFHDLDQKTKALAKFTVDAGILQAAKGLSSSENVVQAVRLILSAMGHSGTSKKISFHKFGGGLKVGGFLGYSKVDAIGKIGKI